MSNFGYFKVAIVSKDGAIISAYPHDDESLINELRTIVRKLDPTCPISVVEKANHVVTAITDRNSVTYAVITDIEVESSHCASFLNLLKQKWYSKYGNEEQNFTENEKNDEFGPLISELLRNENVGRVPIVKSNAPSIDSNEVPTIELRNGEDTVSGDPESLKLPLTFPTDHYSENMFALRAKIICQRYRCLIIFVILFVLVILLALWILCPGFDFVSCINPKKK